MYGISSRTLTVVIVIIALVWGGSMAADVFIPTVNPPEGITQVMMAVVGFLFAGRQVAAESEKKRDDEKDEEGTS